MELDEKWIRAHLPEDCKNEPIDWFSGLYLDGLKVMSEGERGNPDTVQYEAKDEESIREHPWDALLCRKIAEHARLEDIEEYKR